MFLDMTIHDFDMARYVTGSEVVEVFARGAVRITPELAEFGDIDTAVVTLVHENGALTVIDNSRRAVYGYDQRVEAFGAAGHGRVREPLRAHRHRPDRGRDTRREAAVLLHRALRTQLPGQWEAFVTAVRHGLPSPVGGLDGRAPLVIGLAAKRSLDEGRPVPVAEIG